MICPHCGKWEIGASDVFCSWCRMKLVDFAVALDRSYLYVNSVTDDPLRLSVTNTGNIGSIYIEDVRSDQPWLRVRRDKLQSPNVWPGGAVYMDVEVDTMQSPSDYHKAVVTVAGPAGERTTELELVPPPEYNISTGEYTALLDPNQKEKHPGQLVVTRGVVSVEAMWTDQDWAQVVPSAAVKLPHRLDHRTNPLLDFEFVFDKAKLMEASKGVYPAEHQGTLSVKFAGLDPERDRTFRVKCFLPPKLHVAEGQEGIIRLEAFAGKKAELQLTLHNGEEPTEAGRADLQILDINIPDAPWLRPLGTITYPLTIPSGRFIQVGFVADASSDVDEGNNIARINFVTNTPGADRPPVVVNLDVRQMPPFEGVLAIDFGTVNSCCATADRLDRDGRPTRIEIDLKAERESRTTAPSVILYEDKLENDTREYQIGIMAYLRAFDPGSAPSIVRQVKRRLGSSNRLSIYYLLDQTKQDNLLPREVAADIIKRIIERAEEHLGGRIGRCVVSHPSRFSLKQIADLKAALVSCGIREENVSTIHEPLGAALSYLQSNIKQGEDKDFHLMVYDIGGGTTDISLLRVRSRWDEQKGITFIAPCVLGATGDRWFGGEDITDIVMEMGHQWCTEMLQAENKGTNVIVPFDADQFPNDPRRRGFARDNRPRLRQWAEETKIAISNHGDDPDYRIPLPALRVIVDNNVDTKSFDPRDVSPDFVVPKRADLEERIMPRLEKLVEMMKRLAHNNGVESPDVIVLSGKSSALPAVRESIERHFSSEIGRPDDLKECVVLGATLRYNTELSADIIIDVDESTSLSATTSRLGIRVREAGQVKFREVIDAGVPIGNQGLRVPVRGVVLERGKRISILENTGLDDEMVINGKDNPNITELKNFNLEHKLAEWEGVHETKISKQLLFDAIIELEVAPNLGVKLIATIPGVDEPLEFEAEMAGY